MIVRVRVRVMVSVGKLVAAHGYRQKRGNKLDKEVRDERERRELQRTLSPPLI